ncbi:MAG: hypothetical protein NC319_08020 [Butyricicoccus sp.]|nr:hypothetical protein [Butyricicoccus sp.]
MVKIRVTCGGCGIDYTDEHENARHALKTAEDGPFMCEHEQAERLVRLGVAAYVTTREPAEAEADGGDQDPGENPDALTGHLSAEDLEKWDFNDLRKLAADMGVKPEGKKKADYIAAIAAAEVTAGDDKAEGSGEAEGDDDLPELGAADPE